MNSLIQNLNLYGETFFSFAATMFGQSTLLMAIVLVLDRWFRRKVSAAIRYSLWLVVLLKLLLPPSLALPGSIAWWVRSSPARPPSAAYTVSYPSDHQVPTNPYLENLLNRSTRVEKPPVSLSWAGLGLLAAATPAAGLLIWMLLHWWQVVRLVHKAEATPQSLAGLLEEIRADLRLKGNTTLRLTDRAFSPAVCGLIRPTILLPRLLVDRLPADQLRVVLLHELVHVRRGDVWVNFLQTLLQITYWWNPLLWLVNSHIRRLREEAVDDAVMLALREDADAYAPTLLEVAKLALNRPLTGLALVGILESRNTMRQRIERLVNFIPPGRAELSIASVIGIAAFTALAVPMGEAPARPPAEAKADSRPVAVTNSADSNNLGSREINSSMNWSATTSTATNIIVTGKGRAAILRKLDQIRLDNFSAKGEPLEEVIRKLSQNIRQHDPEKRGVNILLDSNPTIPGWVDPATRRPVASPASTNATADINSVAITIDPALTNIRLADVLDAIVVVANRPIQYSILDNVIVFFPKEAGAAELHIRTYKVDMKKFWNWVGPVTGTESERDAAGIRKLLGAAGVDHRQPPVNVYLNETGETLMIRATMEDFPAIERVVYSLESPDELHVRSYHLNVDTMVSNLRNAGLLSWPEADTAVTNNGKIYFVRNTVDPQMTGRVQNALTNLLGSSGVDMNPARGRNLFWAGHEGTLVVRAPVQDLNRIEPIVQSLNTPPPQLNIKAKFVVVSENSYRRFVNLVGGTNLAFHQPQSATGILTDPQFRAVIRDLEQQQGSDADLLNDSSVTTLSGRQTQIQAVDMQSIVTGINPRAFAYPGVRSSDGTNGLPEVSVVPLGPTLDIVPSITPEGHTIEMKLIATLAEFLGYDKADQQPTATVYVDGKEQTVPVPKPRFRVGQIEAKVSVRDGQTVVLLGATREFFWQAKKAAVPGEASGEARRVLVFVTPAIIDPAGNLLYPDQ